jgi:hypothetical protein
MLMISIQYPAHSARLLRYVHMYPVLLFLAFHIVLKLQTTFLNISFAVDITYEIYTEDPISSDS